MRAAASDLLSLFATLGPAALRSVASAAAEWTDKRYTVLTRRAAASHRRRAWASVWRVCPATRACDARFLGTDGSAVLRRQSAGDLVARHLDFDGWLIALWERHEAAWPRVAHQLHGV